MATYWVLFGVLETLHQTVFTVLRLVHPIYGVPTYLIQMFSLNYLQHPCTRGAEYLYQSRVAPFFRCHEVDFDRRISNLRTKIAEVDQVLRLPEDSPQGVEKRLSSLHRNFFKK